MFDDLQNIGYYERIRRHDRAFSCECYEGFDPFTGLKSKERTFYAATIDDILASRVKEVVSSDYILERLQKKLDRDLTAKSQHFFRTKAGCLTTADNIGFRHFADSKIAGTCCRDSAILDMRILESRAWPHMYLTDPPCTCAHIDIEYAVQTLVDGPVLKVRRKVYNPAGVTFGAIFDALHEKGSIVKYYGRGYASCPCLLPDTTIRKQLQILEQQGFRLSLTPDKLIVEFCYLFIPSDAEFEEMERTGRVEKFEPPSLWPSALG